MSLAPAKSPWRPCPGCRRLVADERDGAARCPYCGRWLSLPRSAWLEQLSEVPSLAASIDEMRGLPWRELSPSLGFILSVLLMGIGLHFRVLEVVGFGGAMVLVCLVGAAALEFRADRVANGAEAPTSSMSMMHASSDWMAIGSRRRRR